MGGAPASADRFFDGEINDIGDESWFCSRESLASCTVEASGCPDCWGVWEREKSSTCILIESTEGSLLSGVRVLSALCVGSILLPAAEILALHQLLVCLVTGGRVLG